MRILIQRVLNAKVEVEGKICGQIGRGYLAFVGFGPQDTEAMLPLAAKKLTELRAFSDEQGRLNLSLRDVGGSLLLVSQFTLYASLARGRRPDFTPAAPPELAESLYDKFVEILSQTDIPLQTGIFGADMKVSLLNDGPVTLSMEF